MKGDGHNRFNEAESMYGKDSGHHLSGYFRFENLFPEELPLDPKIGATIHNDQGIHQSGLLALSTV